MPNENWIHGAGIGLLVMINITGNPLPAGGHPGRGLLAWLAVGLIVAAQWSGIVWCVRRSWRRSPDLMQVKRRLTMSFPTIPIH